MKLSRAHIIQTVIIFVVQSVVLIGVAYLAPGIEIDQFRDALLFAIVLSIASAIGWWLFIQYLGHLPAILYPIIMFVVGGWFVAFLGNLIPGITVTSIAAGLMIILTLTIVNAILAGLLSLDEDASFDRNVTRKMVARYGKPTKTDVPGFLFLEIDGLGEALFRRALDEGRLPTLKRWIDEGTHTILGWETDFSAQTGAMQSGILLGNNHNVPAYRWWDREQDRMIMSGKPRDAQALEAARATGRGLLADGGASRGNMFSGEASESILTFSTLLDKAQTRGPGFYTFLFSPYVVFRILTRYFSEVGREWWEAFQQRRRKDKYIVSARNPFYAFFRAFMGPIAQDFVTYSVIGDVMRGVPAVYALYAGYDDVSHFAGMETPDAFGMLEETDRYFARIERALEYAPRPYHLVVLSDHGQSTGPTFKAAYGLSLDELVKGLIKGDEQVVADLETNEAWDNLNAFLTESVSSDTRTASVVHRALANKTEDGVVSMGPDRDPALAQANDAEASKSQVVVYGSGCTGLIYFKGSPERATYEELQAKYPDLLVGLAEHPGIGFVLVNSAEKGPIVIGKQGVNYLDLGVVDGVDPLAVYGPRAADKVRRESHFVNCPDILANTTYDPATQELPGFENQVSHHGGLGGPQNHPFILRPVDLPYDGELITSAEGVYKLLRGWREQAQDLPTAAPEAASSA